MSIRKLSNEQPEQIRINKADQEPVLKGTFASVMLLGAFLAITWVAVFLLFLYRQ
ncbi:cytochrome c oxidase subunit 2A [Paenibacillus sp. LMG 31460]|uniref:Cytochrome c oxidase subunit 2A n=1 Tax=Paenibacillus germinis TaxID=2654979 RepID=A0ABX1Z8N8_9BACL|nr:cytochrome c oxidase subunit 2A [Paenibacillus germinis]NOU89730.1 cytochrome c oxidase subunit 2A [Paenibacillus germinis]